MTALRCDICGRFAKVLHAIWCAAYWNGIDREVCTKCFGRQR